jgi:hypothetical protein
MTCGNKQTERFSFERYFGRQMRDYGFLRAYERTAEENFAPKFYETFPENVYHPDLGFTGFQKVSPDPEYLGNYTPLEINYFGIVPLKIQPKFNPPQPYQDSIMYGFGS